MKIAPRLEHELAAAHLHRPDQLVRSRVGRELDALEVRAEHARHRLREQRLRGAGRPLEQHVAAGERRDQHQVDGLVVADDGLGDLDAARERAARSAAPPRPPRG